MLSFRPLVEKDLDELMEWHVDSELSHRYGGSDWPKKLWQIMQNDQSRTCWIASMEDVPVGYVDFEVHADENLAWIGIAVKAELRKQGLGKRILSEFLQLPIVQSFKEIRAGIEQDNIVSIRCFSAVGFRPLGIEPDDEGVIDYSYRYR